MRKPEYNPTACQLSLFYQPKRQQSKREEWRRLVAIGVESRHRNYSREDRAVMQARYRHVFGDGTQEHPPIA